MFGLSHPIKFIRFPLIQPKERCGGPVVVLGILFMVNVNISPHVVSREDDTDIKFQRRKNMDGCPNEKTFQDF